MAQSTVYQGRLLPDSAGALFERQVFPVGKGTVQARGFIALYDVHVEGLLDRKEGQEDAWLVHVPGEDGKEGSAFEAPMSPWNNSDFDPYEGQTRYEDLADRIEAQLGRSGLVIVVS